MAFNLIKQILFIFSLISVIACSEKNIVVDPGSIKDTDKYVRDMKECDLISKQYDLSSNKLSSGAVGAGIGVGTAAAVLATGGMYLLPAGVALTAGTGAGVGAAMSNSKERKARENIMAACLQERGYKAYSGG